MALGTPTTLGTANSASPATSYNAAMSGAAPSGSRIFLAALWVSPSGAQTLSGVTGTTGLTWGVVGSRAGSAGDFYGISVWSADAPSGHTAVTLTAAFTGSLYGCNLHVWYQTGVASSSIADGTSAGQFRTSATTAWSSTGFATSNADDTLYGFALADGPSGSGGPTTTPDSGWAEIAADNRNTSSDWTSTVVYQTVAATSTYTASGVWSAAPTFADITGVLAVKASAGGTDATVTVPAVIALGDFPAPALQASSTITSPAADATGDFPDSQMTIGTDVGAPAATGLGDFPIPAVSGTGDATVTTPAADALGDFPAPTIQSGWTVTAPAATALGDFPAPAVTGTSSATVTAVPADAAADFPASTVSDGAHVTPHYDTPTTFEPDAHTSTGDLTAHLSTFELDAHTTTLDLGAHILELVLDA